MARVMDPDRQRHVNLQPPDSRAVSTAVSSVVDGDLPQRCRLLAVAYFFGYCLNWLQWEVIPFLSGTGGGDCGEHLREPIMMAISVLVFLASRRLEPAALLRMACGMQLVSIFDVSAAAPNVVHSLDLAQAVHAIGIPWSCVMICVFPLIIPASRLRHGVMAFAGALILPAWHMLMLGIGAPVTSMALIVDWTLPSLICASLALVCGHLVASTAQQVNQARRELTRLGSYQLVERIGVGGMGEVWLGQHHMLARPAAIKVINAERIGAEGRNVEIVLERFVREARAMAGLRSMHTVEIYDYGRTDDGAFFYVMELLDGIDLEQLVDRDGAQPCARVVMLWRQMCLSLAEAHGQGLVHRDLKPANMFICRQGCELDVIKVLDFGLVLRRTVKGAVDEPRLTEERIVYGTPAFMSPEQALGEEQIDGRADLYALGCVIYFLLVGEPPFNESTTMKTMIAHVRKDVVPPSARGVNVPAELEALLLACLEKSPEDRPANATNLLAALEKLECDGSWSEAERASWWAALRSTRYTTAVESLPDDQPTAPVHLADTETSKVLPVSGD